MEIENGHTLTWAGLSDILLILAVTGLVIPVLRYLKISPILGYLFFGLMIGPHVLGQFVEPSSFLSYLTVTDHHLIHVLAELGIAFLLFMIGLELTFSRLWQLRRMVLGLGLLQIVITGFLIFFVALEFGNYVATSILVGAAFALSSTALVIHFLTEKHLISKPVGQTCFSVLLMQDLAVVPILVLISAFSASGGDASIIATVTNSILLAFAVIAVIIFLGKVFLNPLLNLISCSHNQEWLFAITLFIVIGTSILTQSFGLSAALGAFLAGLLVAETQYRHEIEVMIEPIKNILIGVFFFSVGMSTDVSQIFYYGYWVPVSVLGIFLIKAVVFFPLALAFKIPKLQAAKSSILLAQCGEFAFIVISLALTQQLLPAEDAQFFMLVATLSLFTAPIIMMCLPLLDRVAFLSDTRTDDLASKTDGEQIDHIVLIGFGRVGHTLSDIFESQKIPFIAIDNDASLVADAKKDGYPIIYGDALKNKHFEKLGLEHAKAVIVTVGTQKTTQHLVEMIKKHSPLIPIIARAENIQQSKHFG